MKTLMIFVALLLAGLPIATVQLNANPTSQDTKTESRSISSSTTETDDYYSYSCSYSDKFDDQVAELLTEVFGEQVKVDKRSKYHWDSVTLGSQQITLDVKFTAGKIKLRFDKGAYRGIDKVKDLVERIEASIYEADDQD